MADGRALRWVGACFVLVAVLLLAVSSSAFAEVADLGDDVGEELPALEAVDEGVSTSALATGLDDLYQIKDACLNYLFGKDRYDTQYGRLMGVDRQRYNKDNKEYTYAKGLVVATGANHADPISASALAGELGYAFVYVNPKGNDYLKPDAITFIYLSKWIDEMNSQGCVRDIVIVGGTSAVPPKVESELRSAFPGATIERVWGNNRYDTSRKVLAYGRTHGDGWGDTAVVASGTRWPDGTSSAGLAAYLKAPIFLADAKGRVSDADLAELAGFENVIIVGGPLVVSEQTESAIAASSSVTRLWGKDRYGTNLQVAIYELGLRRADGEPAFSTEAAFYIAKGTTYADYIPLAANLATGPDAHRGVVVMADPGHGVDEIVQEFGAEERVARGLEPTPLEYVVIVGCRQGIAMNPNARSEWVKKNVIGPIMGTREFDEGLFD